MKVEKLRGSKMKGHEKFIIFFMFKMEMLLITNVFNCNIDKYIIVARTKITLIFSSNNKSGGEWPLALVVLLNNPTGNISKPS